MKRKIKRKVLVMGMAIAAGAPGLVIAKEIGKPIYETMLDARLGYGGLTLPLPDYGVEAALGPAKVRNWRLEMLQHPLTFDADRASKPSNDTRLGVALRLNF